MECGKEAGTKDERKKKDDEIRKKVERKHRGRKGEEERKYDENRNKKKENMWKLNKNRKKA